MLGAAVSCSAELIPAAKATLAAPRGTSATAASGRLGADAAIAARTPKAMAAPIMNTGPT
jgi:hypothetical protein